METAFLILGSVGIWAYISQRSRNKWLKNYFLLTTILLNIAMGWIGWYSVTQTETVALEIWRYIWFVLGLATFGLIGGLWIVGSLEKEEFEDDI